MKWISSAAVSVLLAFLVSVAGDCSSPAGGDGPGQETAFVVDQAGRSIPAATPFRRIISLYPAHTRNLRDLGLDRQVVGVGRSDRWDGKPVFTPGTGLERFLAAKPDLVLIRPMIDWGYPGLVRGLEQAGITVASFQPPDVDGMYAYWLALGRLTGTLDRAREMAVRFSREIDRFRELTGKIPCRKRVYFEAVHSRMKTFTPTAMAMFVLETAGGINVASDAPRVRNTNIAYYGRERILSRAGEIDVYLAQRGAMNQPTREMIAGEPGFGLIKAVREGEIHIVEERLVSRPTLELLQGIRTVGAILYPDLFGPPDGPVFGGKP